MFLKSFEVVWQIAWAERRVNRFLEGGRNNTNIVYKLNKSPIVIGLLITRRLQLQATVKEPDFHLYGLRYNINNFPLTQCHSHDMTKVLLPKYSENVNI